MISIGLLTLGQVRTDGSMVNTSQHDFMMSVFHMRPFHFFLGAGLKCAKKSKNKQHGLCHLFHIPVIMFVPSVLTRCLDVQRCLDGEFLNGKWYVLFISALAVF